MPKHEIRAMAPADLERVVAVWRRARDEAQPWLEARMSHSPADDLGFFRDVIARENEVWLAVTGSDILGLLALRDGFVDQLYVDPRAQRRGVGTALLEHARTRFPKGLALYTHQANRGARAFYERLGFQPVAFGVSGPPECEPDVRYAWQPAG
ncbi:MAG: GNAT family N-acetyltransferase [Myxococcota bacterium]